MKREEVECCEELFVHDQKVREVLKEMPAEETLKELADFYKVFGDATRVKILFVLLQAEMCVCDLAETLGMTQSAISHQLRVLKQMKLVKNRRDGKTVYYSLPLPLSLKMSVQSKSHFHFSRRILPHRNQ